MNGYWHYIAITGLLGFILSVHKEWWLFLAIFLCLGFLRWFTLPRVPLFLCLCSFILPLILHPYTPPSDTPFPDDKKNWSVTIIDAPEKRSDYTRFTAETEKQKWLVYAFQSSPGFKYGATCQFSGTPEEPEQARNPGAFDYRDYLRSKGYKGVITIDGRVSCRGESLLAKAFQLRRQVIQRIQNVYSEQTASWVVALVFGEDRFLGERQVESFQRWNLSHLLAISGLHVGLFIAFFSYIGVRIGVVTKGKMKAMLMVFLPLYCLLAGGAPSVMRATFMAEAVILMTFLNQRWRITDVLSIGVLVILWIAPSLLFQLGFQFSFLVTFALLLSKSIFLQSKSFLFSILRVSLVSQLAILPIQLHAFYTYNPLSILMNVLYIPFFSFIILPFCLILVLLTFLPEFISGAAGILFQNVLSFGMDLLYVLDKWTYMEIVTGELLFSVSVVYYVVLVHMMREWSKGKYQNAFFSASLLVMVLITDASLPYFSDKGRVTMLDIGQGDTFVIEWPYRERIMMIDAAGAVNSDEDVFKNVIEPYLLSRGIKRVDVLLLTHHDVDHMGSASQVMSRFRVKKVVTSSYYEAEMPQKTHVKVQKGDVFHVGASTFRVLHPDRNRLDTNENSLVVQANIGGRNWLFTGDIGGEVEQLLNVTNEVDVLKVSHHGSRFSSDEQFLKEIHPDIAWISVGRDNTHGHPSPKILTRLKEKGVIVMRTDRYGAVYYEFSGRTGTFYRHAP